MKVLKLVIFSLVIWLIVSGSMQPLLLHLSDKSWIELYIQEQGPFGYVVLFIAALVFVFLGGPRQVNALLFGFLFGAFNGMLIAVAVSLLAASVNYWVAYYLMAHWLASHFPRKVHKFYHFCQRKPFYKILLLRLFPVGSNLLTNVLSGCIRVKYVPFIMASAVGYIPQTLIFSLIGAGINTLNDQLLYLSLVLFGLSMLITSHLYRDHIKSKLDFLKDDTVNE